MPRKIFIITGIAFIALGIALNEWVLSLMLRLESGAFSLTERIVLWLISLIFLAIGIGMIKSNRIAVNMLVLFFSFITSLFMAEMIVSRFDHIQYSGEKTYIQSGQHWGNCYPHVKGSALPIEQIDPNTGQLANCVVYDTDVRKNGFAPQNSNRVVLVGDSFTFGEGVPEQDTLGYLLGQKYEAYNFLNYGQSGSDVTGVYQIMRYALENLNNIKHVVYFYNINDVLMNRDIASQQKFIIDFQNVRWVNAQKTGSVVSSHLSNSSLYRLMNHVILLRQESALTVQNYLDMYDPNLNEKDLNKTVQLLAAMNQMARNKGIQFTLVLYPLLYKDALGQYPFLSVHELLQKVCAQYNIRVIDAYPIFNDYKNMKELIVHPLDYHPNGMANELVVKYLKDQQLIMQ